MCKDCHSARNLGRYVDNIATNKGSHPVGLTYTAGGDYVDPAPTLSGIQVGLVNGNIECSSCHAVHNATTTDGNLLRETMTSATCKECHNYQTHQGFDCLDCHQVHNGSNIMLIKDNIDIDPTGGVDLRTVVFNSQGTTASPVQPSLHSFADGDEDGNGIYDGVCEVCHTSNPSTYHYNTSAGDHTHNTGKSCVGCHPHRDSDTGTSFPNGSCHDCHEKTAANDPQLFPNTGSHQVHAEKYRYSCSTCHFQYGDGGVLEGAHSNGTVNVNFDPNGMAYRNGQDGNTPTWDSGAKTCDNIYCHSNGVSAQRTEGGTPLLSWTGGAPIAGAVMTYQTTPAWDVTPGTGINTCTPCHPGVGNMTGDHKITVATGIPVNDAIYYPLSGQHQKGSHQSNSQDLKAAPTKANPWGGTQCFWCHNVGNKQTTPTSGTDPTNNYQGTYGFAGTNGDIPMELHNDGETWFYPQHVEVHSEGTMVMFTRSWNDGHCASSSDCWQ
jgi:predicted CxxxxCH...CXXCH cytochrome family protein